MNQPLGDPLDLTATDASSIDVAGTEQSTEEPVDEGPPTRLR